MAKVKHHGAHGDSGASPALTVGVSKMTEKDRQELEEAVAALRMSDCDGYADLLQRIADYRDLICECSVRDGSNPECPLHKQACPCCGCAPSYLW